jgi:hypothetical protein
VLEIVDVTRLGFFDDLLPLAWKQFAEVSQENLILYRVFQRLSLNGCPSAGTEPEAWMFGYK